MKMQISLSNVRYRCEPSLPLHELPTDVFKQFCKCIDQTFVNNTNSIIFGSFDRVEELRKPDGSYDIETLVYNLGDKEGWTVKDIVKVIFSLNDRLNTNALKHVLCFWPPRIIRRPPPVLYISPGRPLYVCVDVTGHPNPQIIWLSPNNEIIQEGAQLHLDRDIALGTYCVQAISNDPLDASHYNDCAYFLVERQPQPAAAQFPPLVQHCLEAPLAPPVGCAAAPRRPLGAVHGRAPGIGPLQPSGGVPAGLPTHQLVEDSKCAPMFGHGAIGKVALLVGMGSYHNFAPLEGPSRDLYELAERLAAIDFRVFTLRDLRLSDLVKAVDIYADLLNPGVYGVLYLSGHGVRFPGRSDDFLLPVDAPAEKKVENCLSRRKVIAQLQKRRPYLNLVIWDACREQTREAVPPSLGEAVVDNSIYGESNLFEFRSSVAFTQSYESNKRSLIIVPLLEILGDMKARLSISTLLTEWKAKVESRGYQTPAIMIGGPSRLSLWDPVVRRPGQTERYFTILRLWSDGYLLDDRDVFPRLTFTMDAALNGRVEVVHAFLVHNLLEIGVEGRDAAITPLFNLRHVMASLHNACPVQPAGPATISCINIPGDYYGPEHCTRILISNLERLAKRPNTPPRIKLPLRLLEGSRVRETFIETDRIRLIELFQQHTSS